MISVHKKINKQKKATRLTLPDHESTDRSWLPNSSLVFGQESFPLYHQYTMARNICCIFLSHDRARLTNLARRSFSALFVLALFCLYSFCILRPLLPVSLDTPFSTVHSDFSSVYLKFSESENHKNKIYKIKE